MNNRLYIYLKSTMFTIFGLIFVFLMFVVANEGKNKLDGYKLSLYIDGREICLKNGDRCFKIKPDIKSLGNSLNWAYSHPVVLPVPFIFMDMADYIVSSIY